MAYYQTVILFVPAACEIVLITDVIGFIPNEIGLITDKLKRPILKPRSEFRRS